MVTKEDLILYCTSTLDFYEHYHDFDSNESALEQIKDIATEEWIHQDILDMAYDSESNYADEILGEYYNKCHQYYEMSSTDEGKELFVKAMNSSWSIADDLWSTDTNDD